MALGPIDGRYATKTIKLSNYFSEHALFKYRVKVELAYLKKLLETMITCKTFLSIMDSYVSLQITNLKNCFKQ